MRPCSSREERAVGVRVRRSGRGRRAPGEVGRVRIGARWVGRRRAAAGRERGPSGAEWLGERGGGERATLCARACVKRRCGSAPQSRRWRRSPRGVGRRRSRRSSTGLARGLAGSRAHWLARWLALELVRNSRSSGMPAASCSSCAAPRFAEPAPCIRIVSFTASSTRFVALGCLSLIAPARATTVERTRGRASAAGAVGLNRSAVTAKCAGLRA